MRKAAAVCLLAILIPYITTLAWTGRVEGNTDRGAVSGRTILLDREGSPAPVDMEEYLIGITALQIPAEYDMEAIKAQAIIARTYLCKQMQGKDRIEESALDLDYLEQSQMEEMWGKADYLANYKKIRDAVQATAGQVIQYNGDYIDPLFHRLSAGMTRNGDELHPYLVQVDAAGDVEGENYLGVYLFTREDWPPGLTRCRIRPKSGRRRCWKVSRSLKKTRPGMWNPSRWAQKAMEARRYNMPWGFRPRHIHLRRRKAISDAR